MQQILRLANGGKFVMTDEGYKVISNTGEITEFDLSGSLKKTDPGKLKHFVLMGSEEKAKVRAWLTETRPIPKTERERKFLSIVIKAFSKIDYAYRISVVEPTIRKDGTLCFFEKAPVCENFTFMEWIKLAKEYAPEYESKLASIYELFLWYAYRIVTGELTLEYVCDDSSSGGNYSDSPTTSDRLEYAGGREWEGTTDGIGNTSKIVMADSGFAVCGGSYELSGKDFPMADVQVHTVAMKHYRCGIATGVVSVKA